MAWRLPLTSMPALQAILSKQRAETLSSVLYPDDRTYEGKELRLKQQHFFVSATVQVRSAAGSVLSGRPAAGSMVCSGLPSFYPFTRLTAVAGHQESAGHEACQRSACAAACTTALLTHTCGTCHPPACAHLQDVVRRYKEAHSEWEEFPNKVAFQMNDTHPTLLGEGRGSGGCWGVA